MLEKTESFITGSRKSEAVVVPAPDEQSHHQIQFLSSQHMKVWKEQP
jgi:hypothetical protein